MDEPLPTGRLEDHFREIEEKLAQRTQDDWERDVIDNAHDRFLGTGNPMFAFEAYQLLRMRREPLPDWILNFLDAGFARFWTSYAAFREGGGPNSPEKALGAAFEVTRRRGEKTVWEDHAGPKWAFIAGAVYEYAFIVGKEAVGKFGAFKETEAVEMARRNFNAEC